MPFFEKLFVYQISKNPSIKHENFESVIRFNKGKRGIIYKSKYKEKDVSIKVQRSDIAAEGTVNREAIVLKDLNKKGKLHLLQRIHDNPEKFLKDPLLGIIAEEVFKTVVKYESLIVFPKTRNSIDKFWLAENWAISFNNL